MQHSSKASTHDEMEEELRAELYRREAEGDKKKIGVNRVEIVKNLEEDEPEE